MASPPNYTTEGPVTLLTSDNKFIVLDNDVVQFILRSSAEFIKLHKNNSLICGEIELQFCANSVEIIIDIIIKIVRLGQSIHDYYGTIWVNDWIKEQTTNSISELIQTANYFGQNHLANIIANHINDRTNSKRTTNTLTERNRETDNY